MPHSTPWEPRIYANRQEPFAPAGPSWGTATTPPPTAAAVACWKSCRTISGWGWRRGWLLLSFRTCTCAGPEKYGLSGICGWRARDEKPPSTPGSDFCTYAHGVVPSVCTNRWESPQSPPATRLGAPSGWSGDFAAVDDHGEDVRDDEDADTPGEGDPDVGANWLLCEQVADRVDDRRHRLVFREGAHRAGHGVGGHECRADER